MGLLLYPGNRCENTGVPTVSCTETAYNAFEYVIANASRAYWYRSGAPGTLHEITLSGGAATDEIVVDTTDTYTVCVELCGTCAEACCTFTCIEPTAPGCGECLDPDTLLLTTFSAVQITITDGGVSSGWFPGSPLDTCDAPTCFDLSGTYVVDYCAGYNLCRWAFICTTDDGAGTVIDWYQRTRLDITAISATILRILITSSVVGAATGDPVPDDYDCSAYTPPTGMGPLYNASREWRWLKDDVAITTCDGEEGTLFDSSCSPLTLTNTSNIGTGAGCSIIANYTVALDALIP